MHERSYWWRPEADGRAHDRNDRPSDRPYWWRDDNLPFHHDDERAARDYEDEREARYRGDEDDRSYGRHRRWGDRAADEVKSWFGSERAERRRERHHEMGAREHDHDERGDEHRGRRDYRGIGPRMRADDDEDLREEVCERLRDDADLDASDILVRVIDNEAILDGSVRSKRDAERAHHLANDVRGIVYVRDRLRVARSGDDRVRRATLGMGYDDSPSRRERHRERRRWS
jgi:osmotically-inducible protein OsmY